MRKICVVTGTRAEYGLLKPLLSKIKADDELQLQLVVTGMHLSPEFGLTYREIEEDGFIIDEKVEMLLSADTPAAVAKSIGIGVISFADVFTKLKPDIIVLLGDRFEALAVAQVALIHKIALAHIHGGERTEGIIDEAIRHSITKMSHLHFTTTEEYRRRVIQLGEQPSNVYNVGAPIVEINKEITLLKKDEILYGLGLSTSKPYFLVTLHSVTLEDGTNERVCKNMCDALAYFDNYNIIFTRTNADTGGRVINRVIDEFVNEKPNSRKVFTSLGQQRYLSSLKHCTAVVGNSSSGIIEAPVFSVPTVNIGNRQKGRITLQSIINSKTDVESIINGLQEAINISKSEFKLQHPYGKGDFSEQVVKKLKSIELKQLIQKEFYDIR